MICPQAEKCKHWVFIGVDNRYCCSYERTLECEEVQESRCPDFEQAEEERDAY